MKNSSGQKIKLFKKIKFTNGSIIEINEVGTAVKSAGTKRGFKIYV